MTVKLASALPKDDKNGLARISSDLVRKHKTQEHTTAIVVLKTAKITNDEEFELTPEVRVLRIEPVDGDLETSAIDLLQEAFERRVGKRPDTLNLSEDPDTEFADVAPVAIEAGVIDAEIVDENDFGGEAA